MYNTYYYLEENWNRVFNNCVGSGFTHPQQV